MGCEKGIATTRDVERTLVAIGMGSPAQPKFEYNEGVCGAGILLLLPSLLEMGLLKTTQYYQIPKPHYYSIESIVLTLAFMALARIKNPEQLKKCKPGELGRIIGLDRVPEVKCLREKIKLISSQNKTTELNIDLINHWYKDREGGADFLYVDGHQRIYYGSEANLPAKFISRQKLCLSATTEFWVNDALGMPLMMVMGEMSEKLQQIIEHSIIPQMLNTDIISSDLIDENDTKVRCTFVFDREAYEPAFFIRLWQTYRIAIITYRKNVKDKWDVTLFKTIETTIDHNKITIELCEQEVMLSGYSFREVRKLTNTGHQTSIVTTHPTLKLEEIAERMFARWAQENYFKYMIADYDFDKMIEYGVEDIDFEKTIINPEYKRITYRIKKAKEKKGRLEARFYPIVEMALDSNIDEIPRITKAQINYKEQIDLYEKEIKELKEKRTKTPPRIALKEIPAEKRINKLKTESKILMNIIKMICYRSESSVASLLAPFFARHTDEKRMFVKQIIQNNADIIPDYESKTLIIKLHSLATPRYNHALKELCEVLNQTETIFPSTNLKLIFKSPT
jgi:hypothetical protein